MQELTQATAQVREQIDGAKATWALEQKKDATATVAFSDISSYLKNSVVCPSGGTPFGNSYSVSTVAAKPTCTRVTTHVLAADTSS